MATKYYSLVFIFVFLQDYHITMWHSAAVKALPYKGLCFVPELMLLSVHIFTCSFNVCVGFTRFPYLPKHFSVNW